jgi:hypothetical protein
MSNAHDAQSLLKLASSLAKFAENSEKLSLAFFATKLAKAQQSYPEDHTIGMMSRVVGKMANSDKLFITRAEVQDLYSKFSSRNSKFTALFAEELGHAEVVEAPRPAYDQPVDQSVDVMQEAFDSVVDPVLASALDQAFGGNRVKEYGVKLAKQAVAACASKFIDLGFRVQAEVMCSKDNVFICAVAFETPRGSTSVLVPVETDGSVVYAPSVFVGNTGSADITQETVVDYITSNTGDKLEINAGEVLQAVLVARGSDSEISDVDLALTKLNASKESAVDYLGAQVLGVEVEEANPNLVLNFPQFEDSAFEAVAKKFDSELGFANFKFGSKAIAQGNTLIANQLSNCGIDNYSIAVHASNDEAITYSVALNGGTVAFIVPVKIEAGNMLPPSVLLCNGSVNSFDKASLTDMLRSEGFDRVAALSASPLYGVKASELVAVVRAAVAEGNYVKAEDALNVLSDSDDEKAYDIALNVFTRGLGKQEEVVEEVSKCAMVVHSKHSQYDICGHTGLPLHKTYQDKHGNCLPTYRKGMADSYEGATFMNSKVFF